MIKPNIIHGGQRGDTVVVFFDGTDIHELSDNVANAFGWSNDFDWADCFSDLRCDKFEQNKIKESFSTMCLDAYRAILDANIRGVRVFIITKVEERKKMIWNKMCEYNFFHSRFNNCSKTEQKKIRKYMGLENYSWIP